MSKFNTTHKTNEYKRAQNFIILLGEGLEAPVLIQERFVSSYFMAELNELQEIPIPYSSSTCINLLKPIGYVRYQQV